MIIHAGKREEEEEEEENTQSKHLKVSAIIWHLFLCADLFHKAQFVQATELNQKLPAVTSFSWKL